MITVAAAAEPAAAAGGTAAPAAEAAGLATDVIYYSFAVPQLM